MKRRDVGGRQRFLGDQHGARSSNDTLEQVVETPADRELDTKTGQQRFRRRGVLRRAGHQQQPAIVRGVGRHIPSWLAAGGGSMSYVGTPVKMPRNCRSASPTTI